MEPPPGKREENSTFINLRFHSFSHFAQLISFIPSAILVLLVFREETLPSVIRRREGYDPPSADVSKPIWQRAKNALSISAVRPLGELSLTILF